LEDAADAIQKPVLPGTEAQAMRVEDRRELLFNTAVELAEKHGYTQVSQRFIGVKCGVHRNTIRHHFGGRRTLQIHILRYALQYEVLSIIAQALAVRDEWMLGNITDELRRKAGEWVLSQKGSM
jgi:AcrR family transcriptional regulator